jgi:PEP-CTERM motif
MNTVKIITALTVMAGSSAFAQLATLPPTSPEVLQGIGANAGASHWEDPSGLGAYNVQSTGNLPVPGNPDTFTGLNWSTGPSAGFTSLYSSLDTDGGTVRAIFTGKTAGWKDDFGYTYGLTPTDPMAESYTLFENIDSSSVTFGDHFDIALLPGDTAGFDFWYNGTDSFTDDNPMPPTEHGGVFTAIHPENSTPYVGSGNVMWAQDPLMVSTWVPALGAYVDVKTYLVAFEDWRQDSNPWDHDYSDFIFAIQLFNRDGTPSGGPGAVPEPSTYGLIGAVALLGLAALRRKKSAK